MPALKSSASGSFARRSLAFIHPYWTRSEERVLAGSLLGIIIALSMGIVYLNVLFNYWNRDFFNALEKRDSAAFLALVPHFFLLSAATVAGNALQFYLTQMLQMRWRVWLTDEYLRAWFAGRSYYHLEQNPRGTDNPDQRIAEDLKLLTASTLEISMGFLHHSVLLFSFVSILWSVSSVISFGVLGSVWTLGGDMVWAGLCYAIIGSVATYLVGRPLIGLRFQQERFEADLRYGLMRTREHAEGIALYTGETAERTQIDGRMERLKANWRRIMSCTLNLNVLAGAYTQLGILLPYFLAAPRYFSGQITLGGLTQIAGAFDNLRTSLSWFVVNYQTLAIWKASMDRLLTFETAIAIARHDTAMRSGIALATHPDPVLHATDLNLALPDGRTIVRDATLLVKQGDKVLLYGMPGTGKSTLFRAIAGLWPFGSGAIAMPARARVLFLPQKPYLPIGTLTDAVSYPAPAGAFSAARMQTVLSLVGLSDLGGKLDETRNWGFVLSGGEQQKLAMARALLHQPDWLFLDEATSALDETTEAELFTLLCRTLTSTAVVSIAHRRGLADIHDRTFVLRNGRIEPAGEPPQ